MVKQTVSLTTPTEVPTAAEVPSASTVYRPTDADKTVGVKSSENHKVMLTEEVQGKSKEVQKEDIDDFLSDLLGSLTV